MPCSSCEEARNAQAKSDQLKSNATLKALDITIEQLLSLTQEVRAQRSQLFRELVRQPLQAGDTQPPELPLLHPAAVQLRRV